jgi:enoyl-CoA hydratase/carnithine racemase
MAGEVRDALHSAADDDAVKVIVLTGAGRGFCAGADMAELGSAPDRDASENNALNNALTTEQQVSVMMMTKMEAELDPENKKGTRDDFRKRYSYLPGIDKPVIAAINGAAVGVGFVMSLYCDIRFASAKAKFSTAFSKRGLIAEHGISWILPRIAGMANALDLLFSARTIDAGEALAMGIVSRVFPEDEFMAGVMAYATQLAETVSPRSLRVMKRQIYNAQFQTLAEACADADRELLLSLKSEDFQEGVAHFLEKRPPRFSGK